VSLSIPEPDRTVRQGIHMGIRVSNWEASCDKEKKQVLIAEGVLFILYSHPNQLEKRQRRRCHVDKKTRLYHFNLFKCSRTEGGKV
jgi:hypothetical protein